MDDKDLTIATPWGMFNYRVGFLIFENNKVLLQKSTAGFWFLPGGRVAFGETSLEAVRREAMEELHTDNAQFTFAGITENFFVMDNNSFHELMIFYRVIFAEKLNVPKEDYKGKAIVSGWFSQDQLLETDLKPSFLKHQVFDFSTGTKHVIHRDGD